MVCNFLVKVVSCRNIIIVDVGMNRQNTLKL